MVMTTTINAAETLHESWEIGGGKEGTTSYMNEIRNSNGELVDSWVEEVVARSESSTIVLALQDLRKGTEGMSSDDRNRVLKGKVADIIKQALGEDCRYLDNIHYTYYRDGVIHRLVKNSEGFSAEEYTALTGYLIPRSTSAGVILEKDGRCVLHEYLGDISAAMRGRDCSDKSTIVTSVMAETNAYIRIV